MFDTLCFVQTSEFLVLLAVFQTHSVASLMTADEKSLFFGLEKGKYFSLLVDQSLITFHFIGLPSERGTEADRRDKSLLNTFPFNLGNEGHHNQEHEHYHHGHEHQENAKTQHNTLFPFKTTKDTDNNTLTETVSIEDFIIENDVSEDEEADTTEVSDLDHEGVDFNTIGSGSEKDEDAALGRKCIDKVRIVFSDRLNCLFF